MARGKRKAYFSTREEQKDGGIRSLFASITFRSLEKNKSTSFDRTGRSAKLIIFHIIYEKMIIMTVSHNDKRRFFQLLSQ